MLTATGHQLDALVLDAADIVGGDHVTAEANVEYRVVSHAFNTPSSSDHTRLVEPITAACMIGRRGFLDLVHQRCAWLARTGHADEIITASAAAADVLGSLQRRYWGHAIAVLTRERVEFDLAVVIPERRDEVTGGSFGHYSENAA